MDEPNKIEIDRINAEIKKLYEQQDELTDNIKELVDQRENLYLIDVPIRLDVIKEKFENSYFNLFDEAYVHLYDFRIDKKQIVYSYTKLIFNKTSTSCMSSIMHLAPEDTLADVTRNFNERYGYRISKETFETAVELTLKKIGIKR